MSGRRSVQIPLFRRLARPLGFALLLALAGGCASALEKARVARDARDYPRAEQYYRTALTGDPADRPKAAKELAGLKVTLAHNKLKKGDAVAAEKLFVGWHVSQRE